MNNHKLQFVFQILLGLAIIFSDLAISQIARANAPQIALKPAPLAPSAPCSLAFPFSETFTGALSSIKPDWKLAGNTAGLPTLTGTGSPDPAGNGWLRLTNLGTNQASSAYYDCAIPTARGLVIEFDYATWGGSGADGLSFFLFDGSIPTYGVGANGGSLGYAQKTGINGMTGGYLGLGIDEFGNFSNPTEGRVGGPGSRPDSIALRGPGAGETGYEYLAGTDTLITSIDTPTVTTRPGQNGSGYRHIRINLDLAGPAYQVSASITFGRGGGAQTSSIAPYTMTVSTPATVKMGFAASTGGSTNYHEIRNLTINPTAPDVTALKSVSVVGGGSAHPGSQLLYTITLVNQLTYIPLTGLTLTDSIPANTSYVANSVTVPSGAQVTATSSTLNVTSIALAAAGQATVTFRVRVNSPLAGGVTGISNQGAVTGTISGMPIHTNTDGNASTPAADPTLQPVVAGPNFSGAAKAVSIAGGGSSVAVGGTLTYTVILPNSSDQHALNNSFTDALPAGTTYLANSATASRGSIAYNPAQARIEWTGDIDAGSQAALSFQVTVNAGVRIHQQLSNQGSLSYSSTGSSTPDSSILTDSDPGTAGRQPANVSVGGAISLQAFKSSLDLNGAGLAPGDDLRYTVTLVNNTAYTVDGVELLDPIDPNLAYVNNSLDIPNGSLASTAPIDVTGISLPPGGQVQVSFDATLASPLPAGLTQVSNQASVRYSSTGDPGYDTTIQTDSDPATPAVLEPTVNRITASPAFSPVKSVAVSGGGEPFGGSELEYTVVLQNNGNLDASAAVFTDSLEAIAIPTDYVPGSLSATAGSAAFNAAANQVEWTGDLAVGAGTTITFRVKIKDLVGAGVDIVDSGRLAYYRLQDGVLVPADPVNTNPAAIQTSAPILNYGDLPGVYHTTTLADNGARHAIPVTGQIYLGNGFRTGQDGVPGALENPRPATPADGIARVDGETWTANHTVHLAVTVAGPTGATGYLVGWFDWNNNRSFSPDERVIFPDPLDVGPGVVTLVLPGPELFTLVPGQTLYGRFRLYDSVPVDPQPAGRVENGEVEDYQWPGAPTSVILVNFAVAWQHPGGVRVTWTTIQETNMLGFNIYRREGKQGQALRLNPDLIRAETPGIPGGNAYVFTDPQARPGIVYIYQLDAVDASLAAHTYGTLTFVNYPLYVPVAMK